MRIVADKLRDLALQSNIDQEIDLFGRSAFNRYYYAAYLEVRKSLMNINSGWAKAPHKNIANILKNDINKSAKRYASGAFKKGLLSEKDKSKILTSIRTCGEDLSRILQSGYEARSLADYFPEKMVTREDSGAVRLENHTLQEAQSWPKDAGRRSGQLLHFWRQLGY